MTTKFLDNKICTFKILLSWRFPRKTAFWDDFPVCPQGAPPSKRKTFIFIVVSPSLSNKKARFVHSHVRLAITGNASLIHSVHPKTFTQSREYGPLSRKLYQTK